MSKRISRRTWLTSLPALGGLLLTGCSRETFVPPRVRGGLIGAADVLTMSTNRLLLSRQQLAREYRRSEVADPFPTWNQTNPRNDGVSAPPVGRVQELALPIGGLVERPLVLSLDEIRSLPARTQITAHVCEQGWSAIGEWTGAPLQRVLEAAGGVTPSARYVVIDTFDGWYEGYDLFEVAHPQTILAYGLNGRDLPTGNGAPLRLRVERQCGYKNLKFLRSIQVVDSMASFGKRHGWNQLGLRVPLVCRRLSFTRGAAPLGLPDTLSRAPRRRRASTSAKLRWTSRSRLPTVAAAAFTAAKVGGSRARSLAGDLGILRVSMGPDTLGILRLLLGPPRPRLEGIAGRAVQRVSAERRDLVHVRIQHAESGRAVRARPGGIPHGSVGGMLQLRRIGANLWFRIERKRLVARVELPQNGLIDRRRRVREPDVVLEIGGGLVGL